MPRNPLLGIQKEDEEIVESGSEAQAEELEEEISEEEISEEEISEEEVEEEEVEEEKPAAKKQKASAKSSKKLAKVADVMSGSGTLGDAYIDRSVPMSSKATVYLDMLLKSPLVPSIIPPDVLNEDSEHTFCINSLRIVVPKGRMVQVPLMLAEEIKQSFKNRF